MQIYEIGQASKREEIRLQQRLLPKEGKNFLLTIDLVAVLMYLGYQYDSLVLIMFYSMFFQAQFK